MENFLNTACAYKYRLPAIQWSQERNTFAERKNFHQFLAFFAKFIN